MIAIDSINPKVQRKSNIHTKKKKLTRIFIKKIAFYLYRDRENNGQALVLTHESRGTSESASGAVALLRASALCARNYPQCAVFFLGEYVIYIFLVESEYVTWVCITV